jgi:glycosyltransferase involved in cell wall biosynthesis
MMKILQIGNYPPPACGWAVQTKLLVEEIRRRGHVCDVLNINESRRVKSTEYTGVQNGFDYVYKIFRFALRGYRFQVHVNGQSTAGYVLAILAALVGRLSGRPIILSWRGGLQQRFFPREGHRQLRWAYRQLFRLSGGIICNNMLVKQAIERYGVEPEKVVAIPAFSIQHVNFDAVTLSPETLDFLENHRRVFFCYVSFRPEYELPMLRQAMLKYREQYPDTGFIWLGFPSKEMAAANDYVSQWPDREREGLLLLGNLTHDEFLTLLSRCSAYIRTPICDGVSSSILESLTLGIPVIASDNGSRPGAVVCYRNSDESDLCAKLAMVTQRYQHFKQSARVESADDNVAITVDWLLRESGVKIGGRGVEVAHVR